MPITTYIDGPIHIGKRKKLIKTLQNPDPDGNKVAIKDEAVLTAIGNVPRHFFIPGSALVNQAYQDKAFPIGSGQTISQPYIVARQTELLELQPTDKVLEIGTGSGYQACVLMEMGCDLYSIERQEQLHHKTKAFLQQINYTQLKMRLGDGFLGWPEAAPFDKIIVTCGAPNIPDTLFDQLKPGGILVIPVETEEGQQMMHQIRKKEDGSLEKAVIEACAFVPMLKGIGKLK